MKKTPRALRTDGEATRSKILEAAGELIAASGYADTTSKAIAAHAGVDLASINYHFGSRSGLYRATLVEAHRRLFDLADLQRLAGSDLPPGDKLRVLIEQLVSQATSTVGWHMTLLSREVLAPSAHLTVLVDGEQGEMPPKLAVIGGILSEISGIPVGDPALTRCLLNVAAPCLMLVVGGRSVPGPLEEVYRMPPQTVAQHLHRFAMAGLAAIGQDHALATASTVP